MDFTTYVAQRRTRLVRTAVLLGCPGADAEDVVQTALLKCYRSWRRVARADHPDAYVHRVLVTTLADARARRWHGELPTENLPETDHDRDAGAGRSRPRRRVSCSRSVAASWWRSSWATTRSLPR